MTDQRTIEDATICKIKSIYGPNQSISSLWYKIFLSFYIIVGIFAFVCNSMVLLSLHQHYKKPKRYDRGASRFRSYQIRAKKSKTCEKTRDNLIAYLASFDLLLCLTMPFTALDVLSEYWTFGRNTQFLARLCRSLPTVGLYASSMIILAIAFNSYMQVVHSSRTQLNPRKLCYLVLFITSVAITFAIPIFYFTRLSPLIPGDVDPFMNRTDSSECAEYNDLNLFDITFVEENWPNSDHNIRLYYSIFSIIAQAIVPFFLISILYYSVYRRLERQAEIQKRVIRTEEVRRKQTERNKRRNKLFATLSMVYLVTRVPLTILGILLDAKINFLGSSGDGRTMLFMTCHLIGMTGSCVNPIVYGFRNKHVRKGNFSPKIIICNHIFPYEQFKKLVLFFMTFVDYLLQQAPTFSKVSDYGSVICFRVRVSPNHLHCNCQKL